MPVMQGKTTVVANTTSANVVAGQLFEQIGKRPARISLYATGSATGLLTTLLVQGRAACQDSAIGLQNRFPLIPDDYVVKAAAQPMDKIFLTFKNPTGGNLDAFWSIHITYL